MDQRLRSIFAELKQIGCSLAHGHALHGHRAHGDPWEGDIAALQDLVVVVIPRLGTSVLRTLHGP
jgi:hypothetical protein